MDSFTTYAILTVALFTPLVPALLSIYWTAWFLSRNDPVPTDRPDEIPTLDGLRGILACSVFIHHCSYWFACKNTGAWGCLSYFLSLIGWISVGIFFMITALLFSTKVMEASPRFSWKAIYLSRVFRIVPLYAVASFGTLFIILCQSEWTIREPIFDFFRQSTDLLAFPPAMFDINHWPHSSFINGGVIWTLYWEWTFYLSLPLLAVVLDFKKISIRWALGTGVLLWIYSSDVETTHILGRVLTPFLIGIATAYVLQKRFLFPRWLLTSPGALLAIACFCGACTFWGENRNFAKDYVAGFVSDENLDIFNLLAAGLTFFIIAAGNSLFGILVSRPLRYLGRISYSIYLLHATFVYLFFGVVLHALNLEKNDSWIEHWLIVSCLVPLVLGACHLTYTYIEKPGMRVGRVMVKRLVVGSW